MTSKSALSVSDIIRLRRLKVNNDFYNTTLSNKISTQSIVSIVSLAPVPSDAADNYLIQQIFAKRDIGGNVVPPTSNIGNILNGDGSGIVVYLFDLNGGNSTNISYVYDFYGGSSTISI